MFIIWGFGKQTIKNYGTTDACNCSHCNNNVHMGLLKITKWFTLFFIPIIPYSTKYVSACPICSMTEELTKEEFFDIVEGGSATTGKKSGMSGLPEGKTVEFEQIRKYAGKTETQINYLKQMEELQKAKAE